MSSSAATTAVTCDTAAWETRLRELSAIFKDYPFVEKSSVSLSITNDNRYFVSSEGSSIQQGQAYVRLNVRAPEPALTACRFSVTKDLMPLPWTDCLPIRW